MPRKNSYITVTDQFCGAGGSSQGAEAAGAEVKLALNHWKLAIETHNTNFPNTLHDCTDISACDPRRYPSTDILITSPECTNHSLAKGQKQVKKQIDLFDTNVLDAAAERSRATMWDVIRFAEYHNYNAIIVENVVDARNWIMFDAWLNAMYALGYLHKCVYLNSMHCHPTPQSRDRMYIVFWKKGNKSPNLDYTPNANCTTCNKDVASVQSWKNPHIKYGKYRKQYMYCCPTCTSIVEPYYYAAYNCIDWTDIGNRIGDKSKPLSPNTIKRIEYGLKKYPAHNLIINNQHSTGIGFRVQSANTGRFDTLATAAVMNVVMPFIIKGEHTLQDNMVRSVFEPTQTQTTRQTFSLVTPNKDCTSFISYAYKTLQASSITDAIGTATCVDRHSLVTSTEPTIENCYYRTLRPKEIKLAMAFNKDYVVCGNGKQQVRQLGNAVTPPAMEWLVKQVVESLK
ncbi:MAG: DNA cytosine methyltransferase [Bacteroidetes bacterium]|nr:DNA cytosine methyltransferase [Bacteroidota bacterium]